MDNNSALTLNPIVSQHDIEEIFTMRRLICFYAKQSQELKHVIDRKQHRIVQLKEEVYYFIFRSNSNNLTSSITNKGTTEV